MVPARVNGASRHDDASALTRARPRDPMRAVLALERNGRKAAVVAMLIALTTHGSAAARAAVMPIELMKWSQAIGRAVHARVMEIYDVDLLKQPDPPPPAPAEPPAPAPKEEPKEAPPPPKETVKNDTPPPAAAAAQAGAVLTQAPDPNEPVDLTNAFVSGNADTYAGGVTQSTGTSATAVRARNVAPGGAAGGTGRTATGGAVGDRSQPAKLAGSKDWKCDFPPEADVDQVDQAFPVIQVATRADGRPDHVNVLVDPGHGFGRAARLCAMKERYEPALDHDGNPIAGSTKAIRIRFER